MRSLIIETWSKKEEKVQVELQKEIDNGEVIASLSDVITQKCECCGQAFSKHVRSQVTTDGKRCIIFKCPV